MLTKTQSYVNLVQVGVPHTMALRLCKLSNDPEAEGKIIEEYAKKKAKEALAQAQANQPQVNDSQE
jgi:5,10-methylenetetrahydrofolate reductase